MLLRKYQQDMVDAVRQKVVEGHRKILMVLATGGGKSHILGEIGNGAVEKGNKVLALMHRRQLVTQLVGFFEDAGLEPAMIMSGMEPDIEKEVQVGTCQTFHRRLKLHPIEENHWHIDAAVVFIDEAHHALSKTYQDILRTYEDKIIIGVTATPILASGVGMGEFFDCIVHQVQVTDLIGDGYLVPGKYYGPSDPDLSKLKTVAGDFDKKGLNELVNTPTIIGDVVENWTKLAGGLQTMVFAVKVDHSKALRDEFIKHGVNAEHLDAYSDDEKRADTLRRFRSGDTQVLTNVGLYTEGTDIPEIECIVLARPTKSLGLYLQMVGRGARPYPGKKEFVVLDHGGCVSRLGFYEDDIEWNLSGKENGFEKKVKREKPEKKVRTCPECTFLYTGAKCPQCGYTTPDFGKVIEAEEAELVALNHKPGKFTMEDKKRFYGMAKHHAITNGYKSGWADFKYKEKFKCWPNSIKGMGPIAPDATFKNYITHLNIKWAKSNRRKERKAEVAVARAEEPTLSLFGGTV